MKELQKRLQGLMRPEPAKLSPEQLAALRRFKSENGRYWKAALQHAWLRDPVGPDGALLRQIRNEFGPAWLRKARI